MPSEWIARLEFHGLGWKGMIERHSSQWQLVLEITGKKDLQSVFPDSIHPLLCYFDWKNTKTSLSQGFVAR